jgi:hypothetical protein
MRHLLAVLVAGFLVLNSALATPGPWNQLKVGMSAADAITLLGMPVLRIKGRGFETWTYDRGAELLVYGLVVGWTIPAATNGVPQSHDVWSSQPRGDYFATLRSAVIHKPMPKAPVVVVAPSHTGMGYEEYLKTLYQPRR